MKTPKSNIFTTWNSERLFYRKFKKEDFKDFCSWYMDDDIMLYITGKGLNSDECAQRFQQIMLLNEEESKFGLFHVSLISNSKFMGITKLIKYNEKELELGYGMLPDHWDKGYATEMLKSLMNQAKDIGYVNYVAIVNPKNKKSIHVLEKQGFLYSTKFKDSNLPSLLYRKLCIPAPAIDGQ